MKFCSRINRLRIWSGLVLLGIFIAACLPAAAQDDSSGKLLSGCEVDYPPFCIVHEDGSADGFAVELMRAALAKMGRDVTFRTGPWHEVRGWLERGEIDALPLVGRTPEREKLFDFTVPYMTMHGAIVVREGTEGIRSLSDLRGKRVGVMSTDNTEEFLLRKERGFEIIPAPTFSDAFLALSKGQCDAVVVQRLVAVRLLEELGLRNLRIVDRPIKEFSQDFCFAVKKGDHETLALLNEGLALAVADGTHRSLYAKWFASLQLPQDRAIVIGGDYNYPPFEFLDENGKPAGYNVDLVKAAAEASGLDVRIRLGSWPEIMKALERGEVDAIQGMFYSPERNRRFDFSQAHIVNNCVGVVRKTDGSPPASLKDLAGRRIVVQEGDIMHDYCIENGLTDNLTAVESQEAALSELAAGRHDCALVSRLTAFYWIKRNQWDNLAVGRESLAAPEYCFAVPKGSKALLAYLSDGLTEIRDSGEYRSIHEKWLGVYGEHYLLSDVLKHVAMVAVPLLIIAMLGFLWVWALKRQVAARTESLRRSENLLRTTQRLSKIGGWEWHVRDQKVFWTEETYRIHDLDPSEIEEGAPDLIERSIVCYSEADRARIKAAFYACIENGTPYELECGFTSMRGRKLWIRTSGKAVLENGSILKVAGFIQDITEQKSMEHQLLQSQKMESVGRLAGGVAHDFNNLIMGIMNYTELCRGKIGPDHEAREWLDEIMHGAERSANLTKQLLAFARKEIVSPVVLDLNDEVGNMLKMLQSLIGEDIDLCWEPGAELGAVKIDPGQLDQILVNLCVNARDAIDGTGKITIETQNINIDAEYASTNIDAMIGEYVMVAVSDDGSGMDEDTRQNIFEPFFTTKPKDEGTGLGLPTIHGIVRQNDGFINVYSETGAGTTFRIYLPRNKEAAERGEKKTVKAPEEQSAGGSETILLVEDQKGVRRTVSMFLERAGFTIMEAEDPEKALSIVAESNDRIDLMITDVVMPGMNGRQLAEKLLKNQPELKVLYMSGYTANVIAQRGILEEGMQFVSKPVSQKDLVAKVRQVLDE